MLLLSKAVQHGNHCERTRLKALSLRQQCCNTAVLRTGKPLLMGGGTPFPATAVAGKSKSIFPAPSQVQ